MLYCTSVHCCFQLSADREAEFLYVEEKVPGACLKNEPINSRPFPGGLLVIQSQRAADKDTDDGRANRPQPMLWSRFLQIQPHAWRGATTK